MQLRICVRFVICLLWLWAGLSDSVPSRDPQAESSLGHPSTLRRGSRGSVSTTNSADNDEAVHVPRLEPYIGCVYTYSFSTSCAATRVGSHRHDNQAAAHATILVSILVLHHAKEAGYHVCRLMLSGMVASSGAHDMGERASEMDDALGKEAYFHWHSDGRVSKVTLTHSIIQTDCILLCLNVRTHVAKLCKEQSLQVASKVTGKFT
jgi:hypothetical protein